MPMLTFYFPFPFLLIAILDWFIPYTVAFKIITVLGVFALPATAYALGRLWKVRRPFPIMAAVFSVAMLLMESYSIYGGNVLSTLAGEFGYMLSFALVWLLLGTLYRGMQKPGLNMLFVLNCLILMALVLSHIVTTMVMVALVPGLLLVNVRWKSLLYVVAVAFVGLCLTAFWWLPFASNLEWTAHMAWDQLHSLKDVLPTALLPAAALALIGMAYAIARKERRLLPLAWITVVTMVIFWILPDGRLWNARVLPFFYMSVHLWAAYGATWLVRPFAVMMRDLFRLRALTARRVYVPVVAIVIGAVIVITSTTAGGWIKWNYSGYEGKPAWPQYKQILDFLDTLDPPGRVMTEHGQKIDEFGTPRAFEIIPYWTKDMDTMEGTLMEASYTAAFHFINQAELSEQASNAIIGVDYPGVDVQRGLTHLQLMNIPYLITFVNSDIDERVTPAVQADPRADELAVFGDYHLFRISGTSGYVEVMKNQPVRVNIPQAAWRDMAVQWYLNEDALDTPIVWDNGEKALQQFQEVTAEEAANPPETPIVTEGTVTSETLSNEKLEFDTTAIGVPHWIKISYFPNWHVDGAEGPFLASPSMMMVIPTQSHVTLYYGRTAANTIGQILEVLGWILLLVLTVWRIVVTIRRRRLRGAVVDSGAVLASGPDTAALDYREQGRYNGAACGDAQTDIDDDLEEPGFRPEDWGPADEDVDEDANLRIDDLDDEDATTDY